MQCNAVQSKRLTNSLDLTRHKMFEMFEGPDRPPGAVSCVCLTEGGAVLQSASLRLQTGQTPTLGRDWDYVMLTSGQQLAIL